MAFQPLLRTRVVAITDCRWGFRVKRLGQKGEPVDLPDLIGFAIDDYSTVRPRMILLRRRLFKSFLICHIFVQSFEDLPRTLDAMKPLKNGFAAA
jgi:hypothetical protein